jgi:FkbM family methyltransferase
MSIFDNINIPDGISEISIDVGLAADAPHALQWLEHNSSVFVFGFEPVKSNCDRVMEKILARGFENRFKLFRCAVDNVDEEIIKDFYVTRNSEVKDDHGQSSLYKLKHELKESMWVDEVVPILCVNLSDLLDRINWNIFKEISFLKTDTQGNDLNIIKSLERYFHKIPRIQCESHCFGQYQKDSDNPTELFSYLTSKGYDLRSMDLNSPDHYYTRRQ